MQTDPKNKKWDAVAVISNCADEHDVKRVDYIKEMIKTTQELRVGFFGSCSDSGRYEGSKEVCMCVCARARVCI